MATFRFILGLAGSGKTARISDEIARQLDLDPLGEPILLLVPDQATLLYERLLADASKSGGYFRLQVLTFRQLIDLLLSEGGGSAIPEVTPLGRRILIGRLLRRFQPELKFYRSTARQPGLADRLDEAFSEIEHSGLSNDDIERLAVNIEAANPASATPAKLRDIRLLMREYDALLGSDRLDQHRRQCQALEAAATSATLKRAQLFIDGFDEFTQSERRLIARVALSGCPTTVALAMDPADAKPAQLASPLGEDHPFRAATHTYRRLSLGLRTLHIAPTVIALEGGPRFRSGELLHLSHQFLNARPGKIDAGGAIQFIEAPTRRAELDAAARQIVDWLRGGMRLREILVLARDIDLYARDLDTSFTEHGIPHFVDRRLPASHHPLVRAARGLVQVALSDWRHDAVIELAKSGLIGIEDDDCDALENYLLAHRIRGGEAWSEPWSFAAVRNSDDEDEVRAVEEEAARINRSRAHLQAGLGPLLRCDDAHQCTAVEWCQRMCESLDRLGIPAALAKRIEQSEAASDVAEAARHREVWSALTELLDQLAQVLGDEPLNLRYFSEVVDVAFERFVFAIAPPTVDQVLVGSVSRTRAGPVKACIVLGLSEGIFPKRQEDTRVLGDDDRSLLGTTEFECKPTSRIAQLDEQLFAYQAFTRASERLVIVRPTKDDDGRQLAPSLFWTQAQSLLRGSSVQAIADAPRGVCISTPRDLTIAVIRWSKVDADRVADGDVALQLLSYARHSKSPAIIANREAVDRAAVYRNGATLSPRVATQIFSTPLRTSATRLETFAACPFKHFAQHVLRLAPRQETRLTPLDLGSVYHRVLDKLVRGAIAAHQNLAEPLPDLTRRIETLGAQATQELRSELFLSPGRHAHLLDGVRQTLQDVIETQRLSLSLGSFRPANTEFAFGLDERGAPPLEITTPKGRVVHLRGKIDRVDTVQIADRLAATVIDYKLTGRAANFDQIYFGLSLQLVTYLLVLNALGRELGGKDISPAAAFYVRVLRKIESVAHPNDAEEPESEAFHLTTANKARGVIDELFVDELDAITTSGMSDAYALKKSSEPVEIKRADVLDHSTFATLLTWAREKIAQIGDEILDGTIIVHPYRMRTATPCSTCPFRSVCRFEVALNHYKNVLPLGAKRIEQIVAEAEQ